MTSYQRKGKKYSKITYKKQMQLIDLIVHKGASITETSRKLHVKLPTAKAILSSFGKKNHVFQRRKQTQAVNQSLSEQRNNQLVDVLQNLPKPTQHKIQQVVTQLNQSWFPIYNYAYHMQTYYPNYNFWPFCTSQANSV